MELLGEDVLKHTVVDRNRKSRRRRMEEVLQYAEGRPNSDIQCNCLCINEPVFRHNLQYMPPL